MLRNLAEYLRFSKLHAVLSFTISGEATINHNGTLEKEDVIWALPFVTDSILKLESVGAKSTIDEEFIPKMIKGLEKAFSQGPELTDISQWFK